MAGPGRPKKIHTESVADNAPEISIEQEDVKNTVFFPNDLTPDKDDEIKKILDANELSEKVWIDPVNTLPETVAESKESVAVETHNIHEEAKALGWQPIDKVSRNGFPVRVTADINNPGVVAYWKKTRAFANATHRWEETGYWANSIDGMKLNFKPLWWKDRNA